MNIVDIFGNGRKFRKDFCELGDFLISLRCVFIFSLTHGPSPEGREKHREVLKYIAECIENRLKTV